MDRMEALNDSVIQFARLKNDVERKALGRQLAREIYEYVIDATELTIKSIDMPSQLDRNVRTHRLAHERQTSIITAFIALLGNMNEVLHDEAMLQTFRLPEGARHSVPSFVNRLIVHCKIMKTYLDHGTVYLHDKQNQVFLMMSRFTALGTMDALMKRSNRERLQDILHYMVTRFPSWDLYIPIRPFGFVQ